VFLAFAPILFGVVPKVDLYKHVITWIQIVFMCCGLGAYFLSHINGAKGESIIRGERKRIKEEEFNEIVKEMGDDKEVQNKLIDWYNKYVK
jgi:hypothetical protein